MKAKSDLSRGLNFRHINMKLVIKQMDTISEVFKVDKGTIKKLFEDRHFIKMYELLKKNKYDITKAETDLVELSHLIPKKTITKKGQKKFKLCENFLPGPPVTGRENVENMYLFIICLLVIFWKLEVFLAYRNRENQENQIAQRNRLIGLLESELETSESEESRLRGALRNATGQSDFERKQEIQNLIRRYRLENIQRNEIRLEEAQFRAEIMQEAGEVDEALINQQNEQAQRAQQLGMTLLGGVTLSSDPPPIGPRLRF